MKRLLLAAAFLLIAPPTYAQVTLGTSSSATNPERSGDATTGLFSSTTDAVSISSGGTEVMRVNGTGVGINTTSPAAWLDVYSASATTGIRNITTGALGTGSGGGLFAEVNTTPTATGQRVGGFFFGAYNGTSYVPAAITGWSSEAWSSTDKGSYIQFETTATGTTTRTARMLIDPSGNVGIGTTAPGNPLSVNGVIESQTGGFKFPDGTTQTTASTSGSNGIQSIHVQVFTSSGTYTPTAGMSYAIVEIIGGGGGGGTSPASGAGNSAGGGGGEGAYAKVLLTAAQIGSSQSVTVGSAGSAGSTSSGGNGGTSSLGSLISAPGGSGGEESGSGYSAGFGGAGGVPTVSTGTSILALTGQAGGNGNEYYLVVSGAGGSGPLGFGGPSAVARAGTNTVNGNAGAGYGSGGSGGANSTTGGAGAPGAVIITEFCTE